MSALNKYTKMLDSAGTRYTTRTVGNEITVYVPTSQGGNVETVFSNKGEHFYTSSFHFVDAAKQAQKSSSSAQGKDYDVLLDMISNAPEKRGEFIEAESNDGQYIGILYYDNRATYGTAFVCSKRTRQFLGVIGC